MQTLPIHKNRDEYLVELGLDRSQNPEPANNKSISSKPITVSVQVQVLVSRYTMKTFVGLLAVAAVVSATPLLQGGPASNSFWKGTKIDGVVQKLQTECFDGNDALSCMKYKVLHFLDQVLSQEALQVSENLEIVQNGDGTHHRMSKSDKTDMDVLDHFENYIKSHDVIARLPGTTLTMSPRNLDKDEISLNLKFSSDEREGKAVQEESRKSKLKKIIIPVMVFVLLKAMTLIPLAIGVLGLKAWNALQLSFFSFVVSLALAIFQLCKKLASDHTSAQVAAHGPWDNYQAAHYMARAFPETVLEDGQDLAYNAHAAS